VTAHQSPGARLRVLLQHEGLLVMPGVFDGLSAKLAEQAGFAASYMSGYAVAGATGLPDAGMMSMTEIAERARMICLATSLAVLADADTGYGPPVSVQRTVRFFEDAGLAGLELEDQVEPKRCGFVSGTEVISTAAMQQKIAAAVDARRSDDFVIVGRTDCVASLGFAEALRRVRAYEEAGADLVMVISPGTFDELDALPRAVSVPVAIVLSRSAPLPTMSLDRLAEAGYKVAVVASPLVLAAASAMAATLAELRGLRDVAALHWPDLKNEAFNDLVGLADFQERERRYAER